jgi:hypothetical protein
VPPHSASTLVGVALTQPERLANATKIADNLAARKVFAPLDAPNPEEPALEILMASQNVYTPSVLRQLLDYDPETGVMIWRERPPELFKGHSPSQARAWNKRYAGREAFPPNPSRGYRSSTIFGIRVMAHRAAWCHYMGQTIPEGQYIDHVNGDPSDNRICNLRLASPAQNQMNIETQIGAVRGAVFHKQTRKWQASIRIHLGSFDTAEDATAAYEAAAAKLHGEFYLPSGRRAHVRRVP